MAAGTEGADEAPEDGDASSQAASWDAEDEAEAREQLRADQLDAELHGRKSLADPIVPATTTGKLKHAESNPLESTAIVATTPQVTPAGTPHASTPSSMALPSPPNLTPSHAHPSASTLTVDASDPPAAAPAAAAPTSATPTNDTGGRTWHLLVAAELNAHTAPVTALFVPSDRASVWSGDSQGHAMHWTLPLHAPGAAPHRAGPISGPFALSHSVPQVPSTVACHCKQSAAHAKSTGVAYNVALCSQCTRLVCSFCRLDHLRKDHPHGGSSSRFGRTHTITSFSRPTTPQKDESGGTMPGSF